MKKALILSLMTACISGFSVYINGLFVTKTDPIVFAFLRNALVGIFLSGVLLQSGKIRKIRSLTRSSMVKLIAIGLIGGGVPFALFFSGLSQIGSANATIIHKSLFLWVALLAVPFLSETIGWLTIVGYGMIFAATYSIGGTFSYVPGTGTIMVLGATLLWAVEQIIAKKTLPDVSPSVVAWARMIFGLPILAGIVFITGRGEIWNNVSIYPLLPIVVSAGLLTVYMVTWYSALSKAPATLVSAVLVMGGGITLILQAVAGTKALTLVNLISTLMIVAGIVCIYIPIRKKSIRYP